MLQTNSQCLIADVIQGRNEFLINLVNPQFYPQAEYQQQDSYSICVTGVPSFFGNAVWQNSIPFKNEQDILNILHHFYTKQLPFLWWDSPIDIEDQKQPSEKISHAIDISTILLNHHLQKAGLFKGILMELDNIPHLTNPTNFSIRTVQTYQELQTFCQLVFPIHNVEMTIAETFVNLMWPLTQTKQLIHYMAYINEQPISGITLGLGQTASLWNFATLANYRRQGIGTSLIQAALIEAETRKYSKIIAILDPTQQTHLWSKIGFQDVCYFPLYASTSYFQSQTDDPSKQVLQRKLI